MRFADQSTSPRSTGVEREHGIELYARLPLRRGRRFRRRKYERVDRGVGRQDPRRSHPANADRAAAPSCGGGPRIASRSGNENATCIAEVPPAGLGEKQFSPFFMALPCFTISQSLLCKELLSSSTLLNTRYAADP